MDNTFNDTQAFHETELTIATTRAKVLLPADQQSLGLDKVFQIQASRSRMVAGLTGPILLGVGAGISVSAGFGPFGFAVLLDGFNASFGVPLWLSQLLLTILFYVIAWRWAKIPLGMGTLPALLLIGPAISLGATLTPINLSLAGDALAFASGLILFSLGISLAAAASLGPDGVTALSLAAEKRHRLAIPNANLVWNALAIGIGIALSGHYGPATIIGLITVPLLIQLFLPWLRARVVTE